MSTATIVALPDGDAEAVAAITISPDSRTWEMSANLPGHTDFLAVRDLVALRNLLRGYFAVMPHADGGTLTDVASDRVVLSFATYADDEGDLRAVSVTLDGSHISYAIEPETVLSQIEEILESK